MKKRVFLPIILMCLWSQSAHAAIALVQAFQATPTKYTGVSSVAETPLSPPTAGNLLVIGICVTNGGGAPTISSVSDVALNTFSSAKEQVGFSGDSNKTRAAIWYAQNIISSASDTVTVSFSSASDGAIVIAEYSGAATTSALDTNSNSGQGNSQDPSTGAATATNSGSLYVGMVAEQQFFAFTYNAQGTWTERGKNDNAAGSFALSYIDLITSGSQTAAWHSSGGDKWACVLAIFNPFVAPPVRTTTIYNTKIYNTKIYG